MIRIEIVQDFEVDEDGDLCGPQLGFWTKGHGHKPDEFIRAVLDYCLDEGAGHVPAIDLDEDGPQEVWQRNVERACGVEYERTETEPEYNRFHSGRAYPITLLDLQSRRRGARKCMVVDCREPWSSGPAARVCVEPSVNERPSVSVRMYLCREHARSFPDPSYRVFMVPVGATILLPGPGDDA